ncbi:MAG: YsnF/AvaK domain-containing protein [Myxococcales bacterium]
MEQIRKGMAVHSSDGERLGKVVGVQTDTFIVEKGFFFPVDYTCRAADIADVRDGSIVLRLSRADLERCFSGEDRPGGREGIPEAGTRDVSIPVSEEQVRVEKRKRKAGEVRVSKSVVTEEKQVNVPVTREEVRVERVPSGRQASEGDARFAREDVSVPVMEEEVVVSKRPVVREEVRIHTEAHQEQRPVTASVRREEVEIDEDHRPLSDPEDPAR